MDFWQVVGMIDRINREHGSPLPALKPVLVDSLQGTIADVCIPAQEVGKVLEDLADAFELTWAEIAGLIAGIAGYVAGHPHAQARCLEAQYRQPHQLRGRRVQRTDRTGHATGGGHGHPVGRPGGRLDHVKIAPGSALPGDESALTTSVEEAYAAALASLAELTPDYLEPWRPEERPAPPSPESDSVMRDAF